MHTFPNPIKIDLLGEDQLGVRPTIVYSILILFIQTVSFEIIQEITKKAGEKWNSMTDEDKAPYVAKAQATRLKWEKELQIYKHELKIGVSFYVS